MGKIRARSDNQKLFFDFTYLDKRCREQTTLPDTPANRKKLEKILERIEAEITLGSFDDPSDFPAPAYEIWTEHRIKWLGNIPGADSYPGDN